MAKVELEEVFSEVGKYRLCPCSCRMYVCKGRGRRMGHPPFGVPPCPIRLPCVGRATLLSLPVAEG
jgi:hypothetical protein